MESREWPKALEEHGSWQRASGFPFYESPSKLEHKCCPNSFCFLETCARENSTHPSVGTMKQSALSACRDFAWALQLLNTSNLSLLRSSFHQINSEELCLVGAQSLCVFCTTDMLISADVLKLTNTFLGMTEGNGVVLGIYFVTLPTRAHWPVGWMPATSPSFLSEKNLSAWLPPGESWFSSSQAWSG